MEVNLDILFMYLTVKIWYHGHGNNSSYFLSNDGCG